MQRKNMRETKQRFTIKKFKVGVGSVLIGTIMSGVMLPTAVLASELDSSTPLENSFLVEAPDLTSDQGGTQEEVLDTSNTPETDTPETPTILETTPEPSITPENTILETTPEPSITPEKTITENTPTTIDDDDDDDDDDDKDDDKYEPVAKTLWVSPGATITEEMILNQVSVPKYPELKKLTKKIDDDDKIPTPDQLVVGAKFEVEVEVIYADGSHDDIDVKIKVRKPNADKYDPVIGKIEVALNTKITEEMVIKEVTPPEGIEFKDVKVTGTIPKTDTVGDKEPVEVTVTYKDNSTEKVKVPVSVTKDEKPTTPSDADKYDPTGGKLEVMVGDKITQDMVKEQVTIPVDAPIKEVKYGTIPTTETAGDKDPIKVTIIYKDDSTDEVLVTVHVSEKPTTPSDADKYNPTATKLVVPQGMNILDEMVKEHVTLPEDVEATITKITGSRDTMIPGDKDPLIVEVTYPDGTIDTVEVPLCVTDIPDNEVYEPTTEKIEVTVGTEITKDMVKEHVTLPEGVKATIESITNIPDTSTHGDKDPIQVEVKYADGSCDLVKVEVHVLDPNSPDPDKPVDPDNGGDGTDPDKPVDPDNGGDSTNPDNGDGTTPTKPNKPTDIPQTGNNNSANNQNNTSKPVNNVTPLKSSSMSYMRLPQTSAQTLLEFATIGILMTGIGAVSLTKRKK